MVIWLLLLALLSPAHATCDGSLWTHVYTPSRLSVIEPCISVTGTIADATATRQVHDRNGVRHEADGDTHGWLKVDPQFKGLLDAGNKTDEGGNLVYEVVCAFPVRQADAKAACRGYHSDVQLQPVGTRVEIVGSLVKDGRHAHWNELHPVTAIRVIGR